MYSLKTLNCSNEYGSKQTNTISINLPLDSLAKYVEDVDEVITDIRSSFIGFTVLPRLIKPTKHVKRLGMLQTIQILPDDQC